MDIHGQGCQTREWDKVLVEEAQRRRGWEVKAQVAGQQGSCRAAYTFESHLVRQVKKANGKWQRVVCWSFPGDMLMPRGQRLALCAYRWPLAASDWELRLL